MPTQVCYNPVDEPAVYCNGTNQGHPLFIPAWAGYPDVNPVLIVRVMFTAQCLPFPEGSEGIVSASVDPGSLYRNSGWPAHQDLPGQAVLAAHLIPLAQMEVGRGKPRVLPAFVFDPPVPYYWGDSILVDTPVSGASTFPIQFITSVCWMKP